MSWNICRGTATSAIWNFFLQYTVGRQPNRVVHAFDFKELVDIRVGEGRVASKI